MNATTRTFSLAEARALVPEVSDRAARIIDLRADLTEMVHTLNRGQSHELGGVAEVKALEARLDEEVTWLRDQGIQVKSIAPVLLDFPALLGGRELLLCWLEGEDDLAWYHAPEHGFMGRRRLPDRGGPAPR